MSKIQAFKLISGEEIIGKLVGETETTFIVDDVRALHVTPTPTGVNVGLIPFLMSNREAHQFPIQKTAVVTNSAPSTEMERGYLEQTSLLDLSTLR